MRGEQAGNSLAPTKARNRHEPVCLMLRFAQRLKLGGRRYSRAARPPARRSEDTSCPLPLARGDCRASAETRRSSVWHAGLSCGCDLAHTQLHRCRGVFKLPSSSISGRASHRSASFAGTAMSVTGMLSLPDRVSRSPIQPCGSQEVSGLPSEGASHLLASSDMVISSTGRRSLTKRLIDTLGGPR